MRTKSSGGNEDNEFMGSNRSETTLNHVECVADAGTRRNTRVDTESDQQTGQNMRLMEFG